MFERQDEYFRFFSWLCKLVTYETLSVGMPALGRESSSRMKILPDFIFCFLSALHIIGSVGLVSKY